MLLSDSNELRLATVAETSNAFDGSHNFDRSHNDRSHHQLFHSQPSPDALFDTRSSRLAGASNLHEVVDMLRIDPAHPPRAAVEANTISETSFFRDQAFFRALESTIVPTLMRNRRSTRKLRIWSAACSTGQEAFSLAMLLHQLFPELQSWDIRIFCTDISHQAIEYAQRGRFRHAEIHRGLPQHMLLQHFSRDRDEWLIDPRIAAMCEFRRADLCAPLPNLPIFDLILLRNVLLYFPQRDCSNVLATIHRQLDPGGYLAVGSAEQVEDSTDLFHLEFANDSCFYRSVNAI